MEKIISSEMWPTVSYCCMSSFHRKGMNWRHSLIMKIVCIFLNWESSLRLHRIVLLHITWEGKTHFFCSNNNLLSGSTKDPSIVMSEKKLLQIRSQVELLFKVWLQQQHSAREEMSVFTETRSPCLFLLLSTIKHFWFGGLVLNIAFSPANYP